MANGQLYSNVIQGRAGVVIPKNEDIISEEERKEALSQNTKTQVKLDPLQVCLFPTFLTLPQEILQEDLRENLQDLVSAELVKEYGDDFVYFAVTDAKIDWYSGEDPKQECQGSSLHHSIEEVFPSSKDRNAALGAQPCTCALYSGATAMFHTSNSTAKEILEPQISDMLTRDLVPNLRDEGDQEAFYTELKGASVSWTAAQRLQGGKLIYLETNQGEQLLPEEKPIEVTLPEPVVLDEQIQDSTVISVNGIRGADLQQESGANAFSSKKGKILASTVGGLLVVMLAVMFFVLKLRKKQRKVRENANNKDQSTVVSHDEVDEEIARGGRRMLRKKKKRSNSDASSEDDESDAARYKSGNKILDNISVGSEWTLTTGVTDGVASLLGTGGSGSKTMAEMMAAKETFDRDRQITLQKDMLQSEWSGAVVSPSGLPLSRNGTYNNKSPSKKSSSSSSNTPSNEQAQGGLQFEQATGEGEEIFLMQPAR